MPSNGTHETNSYANLGWTDVHYPSWNQWYYEWPRRTCPRCGYCPSCGRSNTPPPYPLASASSPSYANTPSCGANS